MVVVVAGNRYNCQPRPSGSNRRRKRDSSRPGLRAMRSDSGCGEAGWETGFGSAANGPVMLVPKANRLATYRYLFNGAPPTPSRSPSAAQPAKQASAPLPLSSTEPGSGGPRVGSLGGARAPGARGRGPGGCHGQGGLPGAGPGLRTEGGAKRRGASSPSPQILSAAPQAQLLFC